MQKIKNKHEKGMLVYKHCTSNTTLHHATVLSLFINNSAMDNT